MPRRLHSGANGAVQTCECICWLRRTRNSLFTNPSHSVERWSSTVSDVSALEIQFSKARGMNSWKTRNGKIVSRLLFNWNKKKITLKVISGVVSDHGVERRIVDRNNIGLFTIHWKKRIHNELYRHKRWVQIAKRVHVPCRRILIR